MNERQQKDYAKLGQQVEAMYDAINPDRKAVYRTALLKGIVSGIGGVIGATIVLALLVWILSLFDTVPFVGPLIDNTRDTLEKGR